MAWINTRQSQYITSTPAAWNTGSNAALKKAFVIAGVAFLIICVTGLAVAYGIGQGVGSVAEALSSSNYSITAENLFGDQYPVLRALMIAGLVCLLVSGLLSIVWVFRIMTAGLPFSLFVMATYCFGQGVAFGLIFMVLRVNEAMAVFGIGGGLFLAMGLVGMLFKDLSGLGKYLIIGTVVVLIASLITMILYFTGVYSSVWILALNILSGLLFMGYTAYDIWLLRRTSAWADPEQSNKIAWFFGFKLLTDLVGLIWVVLRVFASIKR